MTNEEFKETKEKLSVMIEKDLFFDDNNVIQYITRLTSISAKYNKIFLNYAKKLEVLNFEVGIKYKELYSYYSYEFEISLDKKELKFFIEADTEYIDLQMKYLNIKLLCDYIDESKKLFVTQGFNIKNRLDLMKAFGIVDS